MEAPLQSIRWDGDHLEILDQTYLPDREIRARLQSAGQVWESIRSLRVRGAPAIGIAAAYGLVLGLRELEDHDSDSFLLEAGRLADYLAGSRPTAVNLRWALDRILVTLRAHKSKNSSELLEIALQTAVTIHEEDGRLCKAIGEAGLEVVPDRARILTHCNTGSLATAAWGTAFSVILHAHRAGKLLQVWVDETRPLLQGSRLTSWELQQSEIPFRLIVDSAAGFLMQRGEVDLVITGADRIAANGDTANKIGTYSLARLAEAHGIPFYVAAPYSTFDNDLASGEGIPIEERAAEEVTELAGKPVAPKKSPVWNPAFDITPHRFITAFITEKGVFPPGKVP